MVFENYMVAGGFFPVSWDFFVGGVNLRPCRISTLDPAGGYEAP